MHRRSYPVNHLQPRGDPHRVIYYPSSQRWIAHSQQSLPTQTATQSALLSTKQPWVRKSWQRHSDNFNQPPAQFPAKTWQDIQFGWCTSLFPMSPSHFLAFLPSLYPLSSFPSVCVCITFFHCLIQNNTGFISTVLPWTTQPESSKLSLNDS